uniref:GATA-type domain-containing protein n=1 Tax=Musa acuminata subsp. malaccensis TaxID=214687 RepID=A0A804J423_MUSAM|nr:PREDICTED: GATA transcription factor 6-like [Musa acuminata subsp. malaccensis]
MGVGVCNRAFVTHTDLGSHSMPHRTLISSSSSSSFSSSAVASLFFSPSPPRPSRLAPVPTSACSHCAQVEKETGMEALRATSRPELLYTGQQKQNQGVLSEEAGWFLERGNLVGEGFSVDDLLNLGEFAENEMETEEDEAGREFGTDAEATRNETERSSSPSSSSSGLTFELPPPLPLSDICLPAHDAEELEWVSLIIDDSIPEFPPPCSGVASLSPPPSDAQSENRQARGAVPQGQGPSSGPTVCALSTEAAVPVKAKRSKRFRSAAAAWSMSGPLPFSDSSSSSTTTSASSCSSTSSSSTFLIYDPSVIAVDQSFLLCDQPTPPKKQNPKKRGRKPKAPPPSSSTASGERRCSHCGVQKTPQWRAGPLGAKTLCNACGVRFKSGRLLPEYRPACSPTFVSHMHSNSHRKVLEMRRKKEAELVAPPVASF